MQKGATVRAEVTGQGGRTPGAQAAAGVEPSLPELIGELVSAGLVSVEVHDDGTATIFAETQSAALATAPQGAPIPGTRGEATLEVALEVVSVEVDPTKATLTSLGETMRLTATALPSNRTPKCGGRH